MGRDWERELYAQLRRTDAVIFLASKAVGGFPVVLRGGEPGAVAGAAGVSAAAAARGGVAAARRCAVGGFHRRRGRSSTAAGWVAGGRAGPGRLLRLGSAPLAVSGPGRRSPPRTRQCSSAGSRRLHRLVELLQPTLQHGPGRFVAIVGPSGSGKSSLLRAGLLPRLARRPERWVLLPPLLPGRQPTAQSGRLPGPGLRRPRPAPPGRRAGRGAAKWPRRTACSWPASWPSWPATVPAGRSVLVVIDQAEELLTRTGPGEQQAFLAAAYRGAGRGQPAVGGGHGPLGVPQHRPRPGRAGRSGR